MYCHRSLSLFFYFSIAILSIGKSFGLTSQNLFFVYTSLCCVLLNILGLFFSKWNRDILLYFVLLTIHGFLVFISSGNKDFILAIVVIFSLIHFELRRVLLFILAIRGSVFFSKLLLAISNVTNGDLLISFDEGVRRVRFSFGYGHPNTAHYEFFIICVLLLFCYRDRLNLIHTFILFLLNTLLFSFTDSRTGYILSSLLIFGTYSTQHFRKKKLIYVIPFSSILFYSLCLPFSFFVCFGVENFNYLLNFGTLTSRFLSASRIIHSNSLNLFGTDGIKTDFGYIYMLYSNGIIYMFLYIFFNIRLITLLKKMKRLDVIFIVLMYGIYNFFESYSNSILMNFSLYYLSLLISNSSSRSALEESHSNFKLHKT